MDGGDLFWTPGYKDGSYQTPIDERMQGLNLAPLYSAF